MDRKTKNLDDILKEAIDTLNDLDPEFGLGLSLSENESKPPSPPENKEISGEPFGEEDFNQILKSSETETFDNKIKDLVKESAPVGSPLFNSMSQISPDKREQENKKSVLKIYDDSFSKVIELFNQLILGQPVTYKVISRIIEDFVSIIRHDSAILLNLSSVNISEKDYIIQHSINKALVALNIAAASRYSQIQAIEISSSALLSDLGMLVLQKSDEGMRLLTEEIRFKSKELTRSEIYEIQKHPILSYHFLLSSDLPEQVLVGIYQHHERNNGSGYPKNMNSHLIHNYSKIVAIADVYCALVSPRAYREPKKPYNAMEIILKMANQGELDLIFVKNFVECMSLFPVGSYVQLKSGRVGRVIQSNKTAFDRPVISVILEKNGEVVKDGNFYTVDLLHTKDERITGTLDPLNNDEKILIGF